MTREKLLSKKQNRALHRALASVYQTGFPNPERKDCPGTATLHAIARKTLSIYDPAISHVGSCSPCFNELQDIRDRLRRTRILWTAATATASIVIIAIVLGYVALRTPAGDSPVQTQVERPLQAALLDLRNFSVVRGDSPRTAANFETLQLNRSALDLTVQLPIGAEEGPYELQIIGKDSQSPLATTRGEAKIENFITTLHATIDTSDISPGEYRLALRHADFSWRYYPLALR